MILENKFQFLNIPCALTKAKSISNKCAFFTSIKSVIERYSKAKEEHHQLGNPASEVKVFISTQQFILFYPQCIYIFTCASMHNKLVSRELLRLEKKILVQDV